MTSGIWLLLAASVVAESVAAPAATIAPATPAGQAASGTTQVPGSARAQIPVGTSTMAMAVPAPPVYAEHARLASRSLLLDIARAGGRLVAVGERGHVLLSDDQGRSWVQAESVPTQALLTGVCFNGAQHGVAVGHDEVILVTRDAGRTWTRTHYAPEAQQPLLDVACVKDSRVIAVGAYGVYFTSDDGGVSWKQHKMDASPPPPASSAPPPVPSGAVSKTGNTAAADGAMDEGVRDFHLNSIVAASPSRLYIAAESGHLYVSDDGAESWRELRSPYSGTFFGVTPLANGVVLAYGLRGNLFRSQDSGATWQRIDTASQAMITAAVPVESDGTRSVVAVGLSGVVLVSRDDGKSFSLLQQADRKGLSAAVAIDANTLVAVGEGGVKVIRLAPDTDDDQDRVRATTRNGRRHERD